MKLEPSEIITIGEKEYIVVATKSMGTKSYIYLISNFKPVEVKFAVEEVQGEKIELTILQDKDEIRYVISLFQKELQSGA